VVGINPDSCLQRLLRNGNLTIPLWKKSAVLMSPISFVKEKAMLSGAALSGFDSPQKI